MACGVPAVPGQLSRDGGRQRRRVFGLHLHGDNRLGTDTLAAVDQGGVVAHRGAGALVEVEQLADVERALVQLGVAIEGIDAGGRPIERVAAERGDGERLRSAGTCRPKVCNHKSCKIMDL